MKAVHLISSALFLAAVSCERHDWEDTKVLHEQHEIHEGEGQGPGHAREGDDHVDTADHVEGEH